MIVEDDARISDLIQDCLLSERHSVESVTLGEEAVDRLRLYHYDVIILDWQLPDIEGIEVLRRYRSKGGEVPVLMLTAKDHIRNKEEGFSAGADDYLTKPFYSSELMARVAALLRRPKALASSTVTFGHVTLDIASHSAMSDGEKLDLHPKEFAVLELFFRNPTLVFSLEMILDRVWISESDTTKESVRTCIQRLRRKIEKEGQRSLIATIYGVGYKLDLEP
ncbi:MAG: response regulator transcription factor [Candidatus Obscuribacterales bacterium]|nr:response regulator transcription factor [Candidatus Obscuribacterales bacterium]